MQFRQPIRLFALTSTALVVGVTALLLSSSVATASQPSDAWITTKAKMALLTGDGVPGTSINVDTFDGIVTIHGTVASEAEKSRAEMAVKRTEGVREIRNLLAVVPASAQNRTKIVDDVLAKNVSQALNKDSELAGSDLKVRSVNDGIVLLGGNAATLSAHRHALEVARKVDGVQRVASDIESPNELSDSEIWFDETESAKPDSSVTGSARDMWITSKVKLRLMTEPGLSPLAINADTRDGVVTLFGRVGTNEIHDRAAAQAMKVTGVRSVANELQVVPEVSAKRVDADDKLILAAVEKRIEARDSLKDASVSVEVADAVVRLTGTVNSRQDHLTALTLARSTDGVRSIVDDLKIQTN